MKIEIESRFELGQVVYFVRHDVNTYGNFKPFVDFGLVDGVWGKGEYTLSLYEPVDTRTINGIPFDEFFDKEKKYKKLPNGWTYNTKLFDIGNISIKEKFGEEVEKEAETALDKPDVIKHLIDIGFLVRPASQNLASHAETHIEKGMYIIRRVYDETRSRVRLNNTIRNESELFDFYEKARDAVEKERKENLRIASLTDEEWVEEFEIHGKLNHWKAMYRPTEEDYNYALNILLDYPKRSELEVRIFGGRVQMKNIHNKTWRDVV